MTRDTEDIAEGARALSSREFDQIRKLAYESFGLDLGEGKKELVSARLQRLLRTGGFRTFGDYYRHVCDDRTGQALAAMIDALATNHTAFLREPEHFRFLTERVVPALAAREFIDVWSAACATGEEVWSLAFVLNDALPDRTIRVVGTDISTKALAQAQKAVYSIERSPNIPPSWFTRYLRREAAEPGKYRVADDIRAQGHFRRINLVEPFSWRRQFPVIFCRNVMIYFDKPTQERLVNRLAASLEPAGYLFVGHSESLTGIRHPLEYVQPAVYRKPAEKREGR